MKELIYYPGFEVQDHDWLKFALLYVDELSPIIPSSGDPYLTDLTHKLEGETDLLVRHRPTYNKGLLATEDAVDHIERITQYPNDYSQLFGAHDFLEIWRLPKTQNYTILREKYTDSWKNFCVENRLGKCNDLGISVNRQLGFSYMTILSHIIADSRGISPMTDYRNLDRLAILTRRPSDNTKRDMGIAQYFINLKLPEDLSKIPLENIIAHRKHEGFKERLRDFHTSLDAYITHVEQGRPWYDFLKNQGNVIKDFSDEIASLGTQAFTFAMGLWLISAGPVDNPTYAKELVGAGAVLSVGSVISFRNTWNKTKVKRYTRKYLADLRRIPTDSSTNEN